MPSESILIVEDERIVARDLQAILQGLGYSVPALAATGADAIAKARALHPALVLMDIRLQGAMDGIEAATAILTELAIPVIYLTAFTDDATRQRARQTAPYGYLVKPFDEWTVQTTIEMALERHARDRQTHTHEQWLAATLASLSDDDQQLQRLRVLSSGIAHNFNNLLTVVLGNAELARFDIPEEHPAYASLAQIAPVVERAADLTSQLRAYAGNALMLLEPLDLNELVRQATASPSNSMLRSVAIRLQLAPDLPSVTADTVQMHQMVQHMLINAAEAIGEAAGTITIITEQRQLASADVANAVVGADLPPGDYVAIQIADTGCGMGEATMARMFDPFFTTKFTGRGLGLSAVLGIVRQHTGALLVQSTPGQGTRFTVFLASAPGQQATASTASRRPE